MEILASLLFLMTFYMAFFKLHYHESKTRRILLLIYIALYHILSTILLTIFHWSELFQIPVTAVLMSGLALLAVGKKKKNVWITAAYFFGAIILVETITTSMGLGLMGGPGFSKTELYYYAGFVPYIVLFMVAAAYYLIMISAPHEAIKRIPLRVWLVILLVQPAGTAVFYAAMPSLSAQMEAGYNNFLYPGFLLLALLILNLVVLYLFVHLVSSYSARLLAVELNKTPPVYSQYSGFSPELIEKYSLSSREVEITEAMIHGHSDKEIAIMFDIAVGTVKSHLRNIYRKTGSPGRYALMALIGGNQPSSP
jgi:DNA-binding CsgD family transcriptional regulator